MLKHVRWKLMEVWCWEGARAGHCLLEARQPISYTPQVAQSPSYARFSDRRLYGMDLVANPRGPEVNVLRNHPKQIHLLYETAEVYAFMLETMFPPDPPTVLASTFSLRSPDLPNITSFIEEA